MLIKAMYTLGLVTIVTARPQLLSFKDGNIGVNFLGFKASAGLGGLLTGDAAGGGLHAEAETPFGQRAGAGLGGALGGNGRSSGGGLYAGATAGGGVGASAGLGGTLGARGGGFGGLMAESHVGGIKGSHVVKTIESAPAGAGYETEVVKQYETVVPVHSKHVTKVAYSAPVHTEVVQTYEAAPEQVSYDAGFTKTVQVGVAPVQKEVVTTYESAPVRSGFEAGFSTSVQQAPVHKEVVQKYEAAPVQVAPAQNEVVKTYQSSAPVQTGFNAGFSASLKHAPVQKEVVLNYESAPVQKQVVHTYQSAPVQKEVITYQSAPVQKEVIQTYQTAPVQKQVVHTYESAPVESRFDAGITKTIQIAPPVQTQVIQTVSVPVRTRFIKRYHRIPLRKYATVQVQAPEAIEYVERGPLPAYNKFLDFGYFSNLGGQFGGQYGGQFGGQHQVETVNYAPAKAAVVEKSYSAPVQVSAEASGSVGGGFGGGYGVRQSTLFDDIFNIPVSTLGAVNRLLNNKAGSIGVGANFQAEKRISAY